jgi:hypothetical protein
MTMLASATALQAPRIAPVRPASIAPTAAPAPAPLAAPSARGAWPSKGWATWTRTADRNIPSGVMQAVEHTPNREAVAQADFAFGGNYMAHGTLDVFAGATFGTFADADAAFAAAQALKGVHGIVGVFGADGKFNVRELLVSGADRRGFGDDIRDVKDPKFVDVRPRPASLKQLRDVGERHGEWGHGDFRTLSGLRFVDADLLGFVSGKQLLRRPS